MRGKLLAACAAAAMMIAAQGAQADGFYASFKGGMNLTNNASGTLTPDLSPVLPPGQQADIGLNTTVDRSLGGAFIAAVGYGFESGLRVEGEVGFRINGLNHITLDSVDLAINPPGINGNLPIGIGTGLNGDTKVLSFMANLAYDFHTDMGLRPYIGAGAGVALLFTDASITVPLLGDVSLIDDTAIAFAYQAMAGVDYPISTNWTVGLEYRFFGTLSPTYNDSFKSEDIPNAPPGLFPAIPLEYDSHYYSHSILLGVTYNF